MKKSIHPLQSLEWGEFRKKTGIQVVSINGLQMTIHPIPHTPWNIGYVPKGPLPNKTMISQLKEIGKKENCIFIQLEPNAIKNSQLLTFNSQLRPAAHPLFTRYTFILDLAKSEQELLAAMHPKTRYNIKVAEKHGVKIIQDDSEEAFEEYLRLTRETTKRQGFFAHTEEYHRLMWQTLKNKIAHLLLASYRPKTNDSPRGEAGQRPIVLAAWILFVYGDTLYYPYGASSSLYRETMASNLLMWEAIKFGKKLGLKKFDMWGALGPNPDPKDPWYGFHRFKQGYGATLTEFAGSFDLVINPVLYAIYKIMDKVRWMLLKIKK